jgi:hypothetical protein
MRPEDRDHERVMTHIKESQSSVWKIAQWFTNKGYPTLINPTQYAKTYEDRLNAIDSGDLYISMRVEVKQLGTTFTGKDDWKYKTKAIVCAKHSFDKAFPKPFMYVLISANKVNAMFIKADTRQHWCVEEYTDSRYENMTQLFYVCPIEHIRFGRIDD